jgi:hypothetical protein
MAYNDVADALLALEPNAEFTISGNYYYGVNWLSTSITQPSEAAVNAKIAELTAAEPMRLLREKRDELLRATDWWALSDIAPTAARVTYRQALRDLPATASPVLDSTTQLGFTNVTFPEKPE